MKTLRLTRAEATAYANGERRFWRAVDLRKQGFGTAQPHENATWCREIEIFPSEWEWWGAMGSDGRALLYQWGVRCPYGTAGDDLWVQEYSPKRSVRILAENRITSITVEQRGGKWGWVVEVGE